MGQDLRYAIRALLKSPGFAFTAMLMLALGIGANTAMFCVTNAVLLRPLPYRDPARLVHVAATDPLDPRAGTSYRSFELWKSLSGSFEELAAHYRNTGWSRVTITGPQDAESVQAGFTTANLFGLLGVSPRLGRVFSASEEHDRSSVAVISSELWRRWYAQQGSAIGGTIVVDGVPYTIIGVMPDTFQFPARETQLWLPISTHRLWTQTLARDSVHTRGYYMRWNVVGRLRPGVSMQQARSEMDRIANQLNRQDPDLNMSDGISVSPFSVDIDRQSRLALLILMGAVGCVLLVACSNVANLMLARGASRNRELSIRTALGASRGRLTRQLLIETGLLAGVSGILGALAAASSIRLLVRYGPASLPRLEETGIDLAVLAFTAGLCFVSAILAGLWPAWRMSNADANLALRSGRQSTVGSGSRFRRVLIAAECAICVVLLVASGLLVRSLVAMSAVDPGFRTAQVLTMRARLSDTSSNERALAFHGQLISKLREAPGVQAVGAINGLLESGVPSKLSLRVVENRPTESASDNLPLTWSVVSGDFFEAMGVRLLKGRFFAASDRAESPLVAVIDESMARRYWPNEDPVGRRFKGQDSRGKNDDWITVIGVVRDMRRRGLENAPTPHVFEWAAQAKQTTPDIIIRTHGDPTNLIPSLRRIARSVEPGSVITNINGFDQQLSLQSAPRRFQTWLLSLFATFALVLAGAGMYSVMHYSVSQRVSEIGVRMALGATVSDILLLILREGLTVALVGLAAGLIGAWWVTRALTSMLFQVTPSDPVTLIAVSALLLAAALTASSVPALRAARIDPLTALRAE